MLLDGLPRSISHSARATLSVLRSTYPALGAIKRVCVNAEAGLELLAELCVPGIVLVVVLERELVDLVREVVAVAVRAQVRHELVQVVRARAERAAGREVDVAHDLVHAHAPRDVATLVRLLFQLF